MYLVDRALAHSAFPRLRKVTTATPLRPIGQRGSRVHLIVGRRPYAAFGNSDGDTGTGAGLRLKVLVFHDDANR